MSRSPRVGSKQRGAWLRTIAPFVILLTLPCYCIGISIVTWDSIIVPMASTAGSRLLDWLFTPVGLIVAVLVLLVLLTEPFHGGVTNIGALGIDVATQIDPAGCLVILALVFLLGMGITLWATDIFIPTDPTWWIETVRTLIRPVIDWTIRAIESLIALYS